MQKLSAAIDVPLEATFYTRIQIYDICIRIWTNLFFVSIYRRYDLHESKGPRTSQRDNDAEAADQQLASMVAVRDSLQAQTRQLT